MKALLALFFGLLALGAIFFAIDLAWQSAANGAPPLHPGQAQHHRYVMRLCDRGSITFAGLPADPRSVWTDEWVNGHEIQAYQQTLHVVWFFGRGVSGRIVSKGTTMQVSVARHAQGCVRFVVAWWAR